MDADGIQAAHDQVLGRHSAPTRRHHSGTESTDPRADDNGANQQRQVWESLERPLERKSADRRERGRRDGEQVCARARHSGDVGRTRACIHPASGVGPRFTGICRTSDRNSTSVAHAALRCST